MPRFTELQAMHLIATSEVVTNMLLLVTGASRFCVLPLILSPFGTSPFWRGTNISPSVSTNDAFTWEEEEEEEEEEE